MEHVSSAELASALARGSEALFDLLGERLKRSPGFSLFTVLATRPDGLFLDRVYSTDEVVYPLGQADEVTDAPWFKRLFDEKQPVVCNSLAEIEEILPDFIPFISEKHPAYRSLFNLPIVFQGKTVGLISMMANEGHFTPDALAVIRNETAIAALALLGRR